MVSELQTGCMIGVALGVPLGLLVGVAAAIYVLWRLFDQGDVRRITIEQQADRPPRPKDGLRPGE